MMSDVIYMDAAVSLFVFLFCRGTLTLDVPYAALLCVSPGDRASMSFCVFALMAFRIGDCKLLASL